MQANNNEAPPSFNSSVSRERVLYHYTSFFGLEGIVSSKSIWCSQIQYLNDSSELIHGLEILAQACSEVGSHHDAISSVPKRKSGYHNVHLFVFSLSEVGDLLSQWRGYSGAGGVSIGFSFEKLRAKAKENGFRLDGCIYSDQEKQAITREFVAKIDRELDGGKNYIADDIVKRFLEIAARFKHKSFAEENEWRLISPLVNNVERRINVRATAASLTPYVIFNLATGLQPLVSESQPWRTNEDICVRSVTIGPGKDFNLLGSAVGSLFDANNAYVKGIGMSHIPYRVN